MKHYLKYSLFEWILCVGISVGLVLHVLAGFDLQDFLSASVFLVVVILFLIQAVFFLISYSKKTRMAGISLGLVAIIVFVLIAHQKQLFTEESSQSIGITGTAILVTALLVFLMTRTRIGIAGVLLFGNILIASSYFLQFPVRQWAFLLFVFCSFAIYWYKNYCISLNGVRAGHISSNRYIIQTIAICIVCFIAADGIYFGMIKPMNPPTKELKLITKLESMKTLQVLGVSSVLHRPDSQLASNQLGDSQLYSNQPGDEENGMPDGKEKGEIDKQNDLDEAADNHTNDQQNPDSSIDTTAVHYNLQKKMIPWVVIGVCLSVISIFLIRILTKRIWRKRVRQLNRESAVVNYYQFFLSRLQRTGHTRIKTHTLREYASDTKHKMEQFSVENITFSKLTEIYSKVIYGGIEVHEEEYLYFDKFYDGFYKNLRKEIGVLPYYLRIFWI